MNPLPWPILLPLAAAFVYSAAALLLKRALQGSVDVWRATFAANVMMGLLAAPVLLFVGSSQPQAGAAWYQIVLISTAAVAGQTLNALALSRGDVSVATPLLGAKVILVAGFTVLLIGQSVPWPLWVSAGLAAVAVLLLRGPGESDDAGETSAPTRHHHFKFTVVTALSAAACFALVDVMFQKWAGQWGPLRLVPLSFICTAALSVVLVPLFRGRLRDIPPDTRLWLLGAATALGIQALLLTLSIAVYRKATLANIAYSARGLFSVVMVWAVGHWFANREREAGRRAMLSRIAGAATLLAAIAVSVFE